MRIAIGLLCSAITMSALASYPLEETVQFRVTNIMPTRGATEHSCSQYEKLKSHHINISIPAVLHSASLYQVLVDDVIVEMSTDNGWGEPYYLYGENIKIQNMLIRQLFVEFTSYAYSKTLALVMRGNPAYEMTGNCRIEGVPV